MTAPRQARRLADELSGSGASPRMRVFTVEDPIFKTEPLFVLGCTEAALRAYLRRLFSVTLDDDAGGVGRVFTFQREPWRVVWTRDLDLPTVLHETFHLVTRVCYDRGIPIIAHHPDGTNGDETAAYLFEFFAQAVLKRLRKTG